MSIIIDFGHMLYYLLMIEGNLSCKPHEGVLWRVSQRKVPVASFLCEKRFDVD